MFDKLSQRGQVRVHASEADRHAALGELVTVKRLAGQDVAVVLDTLEQAAALNAAIRDRLIVAGLVDDTATATGRDGQAVGVGDTVATRRNDHALGVANRDTWTVTQVQPDGSLTVRRAHLGARGDTRNHWGDTGVRLPSEYVREHVEPRLRRDRARHPGRRRPECAPVARRAHQRSVRLRRDDPRPAGQHRAPDRRQPRRRAGVLTPLERARDTARLAADQAEQAAAGCAQRLTASTEHHRAQLRHAWDHDLARAITVAATVDDGPRRLGLHRGRVHQAETDLDRWSNAWRPVLTGTALELETLTHWPAQHPSSAPDIRAALERHARRQAATEHPDDAERPDRARQAGQRYRHSRERLLRRLQ